ncbi:OsmC family protein [Mesorhizobium sp. M0184]|uniref:OsmC family protein n=1 Tax=Mesorhizobium sp. M0184 TaxID=2956906 RepID=UPI003339A2C6
MGNNMNNRQPSTKLGRLFAQLRAASSSGEPRECLETMSGRTQQVDGLRSESRFGDLALTIDEPVSFGGTGAAPNPAEVMLAALGASIEVTIRCYADFLGIQVRSIGVELSAEMNSQGFFGTSEGVRAGFPVISATVKIVSDEEPEAMSQLLEIAERCCPVLDNVRHPTEVALSFDLVKPIED